MGWAVRLAKHLEALHSRGVAHGNISPECVLIERSSPQSRGLVGDTLSTAVMVQYHSPERFRTGQVTPLDDAWALAGTLFTMLTTARPFGDVPSEIESRIQQGVPPLGAYGADDEQLYAIVAAALVPTQSRRTGSATTFRLHLEHWADDPKIGALPPLEDGADAGNRKTVQSADARLLSEQRGKARLASATDANLFAPALIEPEPARIGLIEPVAAPPRPARPPAPEPVEILASEQDTTVMRELPAHIMAMAARAIADSKPPDSGADSAAHTPLDDGPEFGQATKIAPLTDMAAAVLRSRGPVTQPMQSQGTAPAAQTPGSLKETKLGVGLGSRPQLRPGFSAPEPLAREPTGPQAEDDDDGARTLMLESPAIAARFPNPAQAQWKPAPPPVQPPAFGQPPGQQPAGGFVLQPRLQLTPGLGPPPGFPQRAFDTGARPFAPVVGGPFQPVGQAAYAQTPELVQGLGYGGERLMKSSQGGHGDALRAGANANIATKSSARSRRGLFFVCFLVLIAAAVVTFSVLKYQARLGL